MVFFAQLPSISAFHVRYPFQDARIYDSRGDLLYDMADLNQKAGLRIVEPLQSRHDYAAPCRGGVDRIPLVLQNATIATEDATFYKNPGFDLQSIARAAYQDWTAGRIVSGASTITQQLVRANMLNDSPTFTRKAKEVALAYEIGKRVSKRKLLWYYLNSVFYGNLAYGVEAAAKVYFHEKVCQVNLAQAALLSGLPRDPSLYDPVQHRTAGLARMRTVLHLMLIHHDLHTKRQIDEILRVARNWRFARTQISMRYADFVDYAISQLQRLPQLQGRLYGGIDVYTTIDPRLQDVAQGLVTKQIASLTAQHVTDGALVSLDLRHKHYGWILSMVGTANQNTAAGQVNMTIRPRQPGSSMKPFNYIWAFTHGGVGPGTMVTDGPITLPDPGNPQDGGVYSPIDYDHQFHGTVTVRQALANSLNLPAVKMEYYVTGIAHVAQTAYNFGMTHLYYDNPGLTCRVCYALTLGGLARGTRLLDETSAYGVFATTGWKVPPVAIWEVVQRSTSKVLYCSEDCPKGVQADPQLARAQNRLLDAAHAYEMTSVLSDDNARCTVQVCEFGLNGTLKLSRPVAAKTGTTNAWTDNWTVGYTPQIITGVWVGNPDHSPMINVNGITGAAPIWHDFMESAFRILTLPVEGFKLPPRVISTNRCLVSGGQATGVGTSDIYVEWPGTPSLPLCAIPGTFTAPIICSRYQFTPAVTQSQCVGQAPFVGSGGDNSSPFSTPPSSPFVNRSPFNPGTSAPP
jgi:membrane peptidoglycan carboxypeptidase